MFGEYESPTPVDVAVFGSRRAGSICSLDAV
jgi:hypothetical protein